MGSPAPCAVHRNVSGNRITEIPREIGKAANLYLLDIHSNKLVGAIPKEMGALKMLTFFSADGNTLSGTVDAVGNLPRLTLLSAVDNAQLRYDGTWPPYVKRAPTTHAVAGNFHCADIEGNTPSLTFVRLDDAYFEYSHCACDAHYCGRPPQCRPC